MHVLGRRWRPCCGARMTAKAAGRASFGVLHLGMVSAYNNATTGMQTNGALPGAMRFLLPPRWRRRRHGLVRVSTGWIITKRNKVNLMSSTASR